MGPFPSNQVAVPPQQSLGLYEESASMPAVEQSCQPGEQRTIRRPQSRSDDVTSEHGNLVAEHDDLDRQLVAIPPAQPHQFRGSG